MKHRENETISPPHKELLWILAKTQVTQSPKQNLTLKKNPKKF